MKKNIAIILSVVTIVVFVTYGFIKSREAQMHAGIALKAQSEAAQRYSEVDKQAELAREAAARAVAAHAHAVELKEQLEMCRSR